MRRRKKTAAQSVKKIIALALSIGIVVALLVYRRDMRDWFLDEHKYDREIARAAGKHGVDSRLIKAVIYRESRFKPDAKGRDGEVGLMQVIPSCAVKDWARCHKVETPAKGLLFKPELNIDIGTWYLSKALRQWAPYKHGIELALCQYNAGPSRAAKWKPDSPEGAVMERIDIKSTRMYVNAVMEKYQQYCKQKN